MINIISMFEPFIVAVGERTEGKLVGEIRRTVGGHAAIGGVGGQVGDFCSDLDETFCELHAGVYVALDWVG